MSRKNLSSKIRFEVIQRDGGRCRYCGRSAPDIEIEIDHIIPQSSGGSDRSENLCVACKDCNRGKRDELVEAPWVGPLTDALARGRGLVVAEFYCDRPGCPAREITLCLKDYESEAVRMMKSKGKTKCPVCGKHLKMHWVRTYSEDAKYDERKARESVNTQIYIRDYCGKGLACVPLNVSMDDALPPFRAVDLREQPPGDCEGRGEGSYALGDGHKP